MKNTVLSLIIVAVPALALAGGDSTPQEHEHATEQHEKAPQQHEHAAQGHEKAEQKHEHGSNSGDDHHASVAGRPGEVANINRTVEVSMGDNMRFTPDQLDFDAGETVRFSLQNNGKIPHEFVIGSMSELLEHAEMMRSMPNMQHAESNMLTLAAGGSGEIVWQFDQAGTVDFACLIPGHLEAGMKGSIKVE